MTGKLSNKGCFINDKNKIVSICPELICSIRDNPDETSLQISNMVRDAIKPDLISVCRNFKLANVFYRLELIEACGTGIIKIMEAYEGTGMTPQIKTSDNAFKIILPNLNAMPEPARQMQVNPEEGTPEEKVIALTEQRGFVTRKEIEILLGMGQSSCGRLLKKMIENGLLIQEGKGKNIRYCLPQ